MENIISFFFLIQGAVTSCSVQIIDFFFNSRVGGRTLLCINDSINIKYIAIYCKP